MKLIKNTLPSKTKAISALVVLILGIGMIPTNLLVNNMVQSEINQGIADQITVPDPDDEEAIDIWKEPHEAEGAPSSYTSYYMWNLTNPDEVLQGETPIYQEIGPYTFRVYTYKYNVKFSDDEEEVKYNSYSRRDFRPGKSGVSLKLNDSIVNINPAYLGVLEEMGNEANLVKAMFPEILKEVKSNWEVEFEKELAVNAQLQGLIKAPWYLGVQWNWTLPPTEGFFFNYWANESGSALNTTGTPQSPGYWLPLGPLVMIIVVGTMTFSMRAGGDIDGRYGYAGTPLWDLNISTGSRLVPSLLPDTYQADPTKPGIPSNITLSQCKALWNITRPNSLLNGTPEIWYDAVEGDITSQDTLKSDFGLSDAQLNMTLDWINVSLNGWLKNIAQWQINNWSSGLITTRAVEEWLFTANDTLVYQQDPARAAVNIFSNIHNVSEAIEKGTDRYTIKTGKGDINEVGQRIEFNGQDEITIWAETFDVKGTGGTQFAPGISQDDELEVFSSDFMRTLEFDFHRTTSIYDIELYQFKFDDGTFEPNPDYYMCIDGCANVYPCQGIPAYLSKPHFLDGDPILTSSVSGMKPNKEDHDTYFEVEPITGITMKGRTRMQVNFMTSQTDLWYPNITEAMMPIVWFEDRSEITEELAEDFKDLVYGALDLQQNLNLLTLGAAAAFGVPGAIFTTTQAIKRKKLKAR